MNDLQISFRSFQPEADVEWIKPYLSIPWVSDLQGIVACIGDRQTAACLLHSWTHNSVMSHIVILKPIVLKYGFIQEVMKHVFITCGRKIMLGSVPGDNAKALAFDQHIGFCEVARIEDGFRDGVDMVLIALKKEDCKWIDQEVRNEQRQEG